MYRNLPNSPESQIFGRQLLRSATSVASNYRAARRARSKAEFISKLCIVVEEADETLFWLEIIEESGIGTIEKEILREAKELVFILSAARRTAQQNQKN